MDAERAADLFARAFNRVALGLGVIAAGWMIHEGYVLRGVLFLVVGVPLYFYLHNRFDAP